MQEALSELKIPSVLYTTDSLFSSHEALEMERVLAGIAQPDNENLLKISLATDMLGLNGQEIYGLSENENKWEKWLIRFREYNRLWNEHGFMRMFKALDLNGKILPRLMTFPDGERRCTNLLHLSEALHKATINNRLSKEGLVKWLSEKRNTDALGDEEHQLRLESDENAIKLVTIHRSKGLEFPIVFCPFAWGGSKSRNKTTPLMFHDKITRGLTLDLGSENMEQNRLYAEKEALAENLRVLYVALTRAKNRCYLVWGRINKADTSAPAYLFHQPDTTDSRDNIVNATGAGFKALSEKELYTELESVCDRAEGTIRLSEMPDEAGVGYSPLSDEQIEPVFREFKGKIDRQFRISSFSSIISSRPNSAELADHDGLGEPDDPYNQEKLAELVREEEPSGIFSFPKGAKAGTFMHDIFEHLDFDERDDSYKRKVIKTKLTEYGFETSWEETIYQMVNNVLSVPLTIDQQGLTLSHIPNQNRLNELGFYFPLKSISPNNLKRIYEKIPQTESIIGFPEHMGSLNFSSVNGFMKGFMDMVFQFQDKFYLVDWKSNHLGNSVSDYNGAALLSAMMKNLYILQCHIYTAALNQYLQIRLPDYSYERHFGEVFYIFLRGVDTDAGPDFGIYRDRPSVEFIEEFCKGLIDK
ncbi:MAG: hypothetical protein GY864_03015 [Desulfobacterales bacterium]|nr:hypothetical protein [Desulfobacterales bacterium]